MGDWVKREADFRLSHPEVFERSWESILVDDDHDGLARLLGDMLKVKPNGVRVGKRPVLSRVDAEQRLAAISGDDFSDDPFLPTFRRLCEGRSLQNVASRTGLSRSHVQKLLAGSYEPSLVSLERIAEGFKRSPAFFLEYRVSVVAFLLHDFLVSNPELATVWYMKLRGNDKLRVS